MLLVMIYSVHFLWTGVSVTTPKCAARCVWNKGAVVSTPWKGCATLERERETYLGMGEKMLSPARNFLMVPPALNQLCRFSCCALRNSLLRCFHCCEVNVLRILSDKNKESEAKRGRNVSEHAGVHYHFVGVKITIKCLYLMHLSISGISDAA